MFVTPYGILIQIREIQLIKAKFPIFVTLFGILMLLSDIHFQYLLLVDYQYYTL